MTGSPGPRAISGNTKVLAVWGHPVAHSRSPAMQNAALAELGLDWVYVPCDVAPERIQDAVAAVRALGLVGVNITVPLKELAVPLMDDLDPNAAAIGSVNTVTNCEGRLKGYSTDGPGFLWDLERKGIDPKGASVFIWGAGGSAKAVAFALAGYGCQITITNRTAERARTLAAAIGDAARTVAWGSAQYAEAIHSAHLLVNTTSLGMAGASTKEIPPLSDGTLHPGQIVYDLVYNPSQTRLMQEAIKSGCQVHNGLGMLVCQGAISLSVWSGLPLSRIPVETMQRAAADSAV